MTKRSDKLANIDSYADTATSSAADGGCCSKLGTFLYNRDTGEIIGRRPFQWCQLLLFYAIFWGVLAAFFAGFFQLFMHQISYRIPRLYNDFGIIKDASRTNAQPSMAVWPGFSISFTGNTTTNETYSAYVDELDAILQRYENPPAEAKQCSITNGANEDEFCHFDIGQLGSCRKGGNYGYDEGKPCVLLRLNRIIGWDPKPISCSSDKHCVGLSEDDVKFFNSTGRPGQPLTQIFDGLSVVFTCEASKASLKRKQWMAIETEWFPKSGSVPIWYFPYWNQPGYMSPFVMAKFNVAPDEKLLVRCRAWAQNIRNRDVITKEGAVHFEIFIENAK